MAQSYSLGFLPLALFVGCFGALSGCGSDDHPPGSTVSAGGESAQGGGNASGSSSLAGKGDGGEAHEAGSANDMDGGAAGNIEIGTPPTPLAVYPSTLEANVECNSAPDANLLLQNAGGSTLSITSASADSGYIVKTMLPISIEPGSAAELLITPPAAAANAQGGDKVTGTLSFHTNEPGLPEHQVALSTQLFTAQLEFTDHDGVPLTSALTLSYLSDSTCPDTVKYRVHNKGNVAFTLVGPTFPTNLGGTTTGASGQNIAPDDYVELMVGGVSAPGDACSASGQLSFTTKGSYCGSAPALDVTWPASAGPTCACTVAP